MMKLKKLEEYLQGVDGFTKPNILLEQYATPAHIAACMLHTIQSKYGDLAGRYVADLGSGCGMLSIGAFLMGASATVGFELDAAAVEIFRANVSDMELPTVDCVQCNVNDLTAAGSRWTRTFDTVLLNPPFGTKHNAGEDVRFVETALAVCRGAVYSLHKTSTREFIRKKADRDWGLQAEVMAQLRYDLKASYRFHKKNSVDIEVDLWRFDVSTATDRTDV